MRLTTKWTPTTEEAFGPKGLKGREGELFVIKVVSSWGYFVKDLESDKGSQIQGHDILIRKPTWQKWYSVDVKNNMAADGSFLVETSKNGWLFDERKTSDRIWHCNTKTGQMAWYDRQKMKKYILGIYGNFDVPLFRVSSKKSLSFVTWRYSKDIFDLGKN